MAKLPFTCFKTKPLFCCFLNLPYFPILLALRYKNVLNGGIWHLCLVQYCLQDTSISLFFMEQLYTNTNRVICDGSYGLIVYSGLVWKIIGHSASPRALLLLYQAFIHYKTINTPTHTLLARYKILREDV